MPEQSDISSTEFSPNGADGVGAAEEVPERAVAFDTAVPVNHNNTVSAIDRRKQYRNKKQGFSVPRCVKKDGNRLISYGTFLSTSSAPSKDLDDNNSYFYLLLLSKLYYSFDPFSTADELNHAKERWEEESWQLKALRFINSDIVQKVLICMLLLDVIILFTELAIDAFYPACKLVLRDAISVSLLDITCCFDFASCT